MMAYTNEVKQGLLPNYYDKENLGEDDEDDEDNQFIISLEDNGEEDGLLCSPEDVLQYNPSLCQIPTTTIDEQILRKPLVLEPSDKSSGLDTEIITFPAHYATKNQGTVVNSTSPSNFTNQNAHSIIIQGHTAERQSEIIPSAFSNSDFTVVRSKENPASLASLKDISSLNYELDSQRNKSYNNFSGTDKDNYSGTAAAPLNLSTSQKDYNRTTVPNNEALFSKSPKKLGTESCGMLLKCLINGYSSDKLEKSNPPTAASLHPYNSTSNSHNHVGEPLSSLPAQPTVHSPSLSALLSRAATYQSQFNTEKYNVPTLSGPFPRNETPDSKTENCTRLPDNHSISTDTTSCTCIMCYKGRGIFDSDPTVTLPKPQEEVSLKRKRPCVSSRGEKKQLRQLGIKSYQIQPPPPMSQIVNGNLRINSLKTPPQMTSFPQPLSNVAMPSYMLPPNKSVLGPAEAHKHNSHSLTSHSLLGRVASTTSPLTKLTLSVTPQVTSPFTPTTHSILNSTLSSPVSSSVTYKIVHVSPDEVILSTSNCTAQSREQVLGIPSTVRHPVALNATEVNLNSPLVPHSPSNAGKINQSESSINTNDTGKINQSESSINTNDNLCSASDLNKLLNNADKIDLSTPSHVIIQTRNNKIAVLSTASFDKTSSKSLLNSSSFRNPQSTPAVSLSSPSSSSLGNLKTSQLSPQTLLGIISSHLHGQPFKAREVTEDKGSVSSHVVGSNKPAAPCHTLNMGGKVKPTTHTAAVSQPTVSSHKDNLNTLGSRVEATLTYTVASLPAVSSYKEPFGTPACRAESTLTYTNVASLPAVSSYKDPFGTPACRAEATLTYTNVATLPAVSSYKDPFGTPACRAEATLTYTNVATLPAVSSYKEPFGTPACRAEATLTYTNVATLPAVSSYKEPFGTPASRAEATLTYTNVALPTVSSYKEPFGTPASRAEATLTYTNVALPTVSSYKEPFGTPASRADATLTEANNACVKCQENPIPQPPAIGSSKSYLEDWVDSAKTFSSQNHNQAQFLQKNSDIDQSAVSGCYSTTSNQCKTNVKLENSSIYNCDIEYFPNTSNSWTKKDNSATRLDLPRSPRVSQAPNVKPLIHNEPDDKSDDPVVQPPADRVTERAGTHQPVITASQSIPNLNPVLNQPNGLINSLKKGVFSSRHPQFKKSRLKSVVDMQNGTSSTVISGSEGIKLKIRLSENSKSPNKCSIDPLITKAGVSQISLNGEETGSHLLQQVAGKIETVNKEAVACDRVETAEEMFQRFQEQAMQEVFKAQLGVGSVSRSLRPTRHNLAFLDKPIERDQSKKKKYELEKSVVDCGLKVNSDVPCINKENLEEKECKKRRRLSDEPGLVKFPRLSINDYPRLKQDNSISYRKRIVCSNILAGHKVYVKFNTYENMHSGRCFLVPFFNIGGSRTQFDVEDMEYINQAVAEFEREERSCARHLLYYTREGNKAVFLRKETNLHTYQVSEKNYKKCSFVLDGFKREAPKPVEPVVEQWKVDQSVDIEIDRAEVDNEIEENFESLINMSTEKAAAVHTSPVSNCRRRYSVDSSTCGADSPADMLTQETVFYHPKDSGDKLPFSQLPISNTSSQRVTLHQLFNLEEDSTHTVTPPMTKKDSELEIHVLNPCSLSVSPDKQKSLSGKTVENGSYCSVLLSNLNTVIKSEVIDDSYEEAINIYTSSVDPFLVTAEDSVLKTPANIKQEAVNDEHITSEADQQHFDQATFENQIDKTQGSPNPTPAVSPKPISSSEPIDMPSNEITAGKDKRPCLEDPTLDSSSQKTQELDPSLKKTPTDTDSLLSPVDSELVETESLPPSSSISESSEISTSSEIEDSGEELEDDLSMTGSLADMNESQHPVQSKITSLVESLRQRLTQETPNLPPWLAGQPPPLIKAKLKKKRLRNKEKSTTKVALVADNQLPQEGGNECLPSNISPPVEHIQVETPVSDTSSICTLTCSDTTNSTILVPSTSATSPENEPSVENNAETSALLDTRSTEISTGSMHLPVIRPVENIVLTQQQPVASPKTCEYLTTHNVTSVDTSTIPSVFGLNTPSSSGMEPSAEAVQIVVPKPLSPTNNHKMHQSVPLCDFRPIESTHSTPGLCETDLTLADNSTAPPLAETAGISTCSTPSDFEIEVGTEEFPDVYLSCPSLLPNLDSLPSSNSKITWRAFSKPYSILVSQNHSSESSSRFSPISTGSPASSFSPTKLQNTQMCLNKRNANQRSRSKARRKFLSRPRSNKRRAQAKEAQQLYLPTVSQESESVTSYLSKKFSSSDSKIKGPRLLSANKTPVQKKQETVTNSMPDNNTQTQKQQEAVGSSKLIVPEPISTEELSKTPSLSEIFGIDIKPEAIQTSSAAQYKLHNNIASSGQDSRTSTGTKQVAKKRTSRKCKRKKGSKVTPNPTDLNTFSEVSCDQPKVIQSAKRNKVLTKNNVQLFKSAARNTISHDESNKAIISKTTGQISEELLSGFPRCCVIVHKVEDMQLEPGSSAGTYIIRKNSAASVNSSSAVNTSTTEVYSSTAEVSTTAVKLEPLNADTTTTTKTSSKRLFNSRKKKRASRKSGPRPKKDIVEYYASMLESLQKKAQQLEEESKKQKEEESKKQKEEESKKQKEEESKKQKEEESKKQKEEEIKAKEAFEKQSNEKMNSDICAEKTNESEENVEMTEKSDVLNESTEEMGGTSDTNKNPELFPLCYSNKSPSVNNVHEKKFSDKKLEDVKDIDEMNVDEFLGQMDEDLLNQSAEDDLLCNTNGEEKELDMLLTGLSLPGKILKDSCTDETKLLENSEVVQPGSKKPDNLLDMDIGMSCVINKHQDITQVPCPAQEMEANFGKKDILLSSKLDEDKSNKQKVLDEEDMFLEADEDDDDFGIIPQIDVEKLLGLDDNDACMDEVTTESRDVFAGNDPLRIKNVREDTSTAESKNSQAEKVELSVNGSINGETQQDEPSPPATVWKNILGQICDQMHQVQPSPSNKQASVEIKPSTKLSSLKFKLKLPSGALIKSLQLSKEVKNVFGEAASEGNSPTEESPPVTMKSQLSDVEHGARGDSSSLDAKPPIPKLKVKLHKETLCAIEKAKAQFILTKKIEKKVKAKSPVKRNRQQDQQFEQDMSFYLRTSKIPLATSAKAEDTAMVCISSGENPCNNKGDSNSTLTEEFKKSKNSTTVVSLPDHSNDSVTSCNSHGNDQKNEGIFSNVNMFKDPTEGTVCTQINSQPSNSVVPNAPKKLNLNIDISKLKMKLKNPMLSCHSKKPSLDQANHSPQPTDMALSTSNQAASNGQPISPVNIPTSVPSVSSKPLPVFNSAKLCNLLKNMHKKTKEPSSSLENTPSKSSDSIPSPASAPNTSTEKAGRGPRRSLRNSPASSTPIKPVKNTRIKTRSKVVESSTSANIAPCVPVPPKEQEDKGERSFFDCLTSVLEGQQNI
ncbi:uncharacterized protein LOC131937010 [Physella acuta]|uniref:uncharacterized protein LOC131937010 n=1 Tax=Physella acuta TaxID=109671 RepID=UPI0027DADF4E|nr:uncharacterized protein LOC131937010 [Physella acuta]